MHASVYKSLRKADTCVYLAEREDFGRLPEPLRSQLQPLQFVLCVDLSPERKLAREDPTQVRENLFARFPPAAAAVGRRRSDEQRLGDRCLSRYPWSGGAASRSR